MFRLCTTTIVFHIAETCSFLDHLNKVLFVDWLFIVTYGHWHRQDDTH